MSTRTVTLSAEHLQRISDALLDYCDEGPPGEGWKSPGLSSAVAALDAALTQPEPVEAEPTRRQIMMLADGFATDPGGRVLLVREALRRWGRSATALAQPEPVPPSLLRTERRDGPWGEWSALIAQPVPAPDQPEPVGPTDDQAEDLADALNFMDGYAEHEDGFYVCASNLGPFARAILARWCRPAITPIPVSERLPGPEDCDAEGRVWAWYRNDPEDEYQGDLWAPLHLRLVTASQNVTHWLPANAVPLPGQPAPDAPAP